MVTLSIILLVLVLLAFAVQFICARRLGRRIADLEQRIKALDALYDGIEETVSRVNADIGTLNTNLEQWKNTFKSKQSKVKP